MTHLKVCCIQDAGEAEIALQRGAAALGLVSAMPSGPGPISVERIAQIASLVRGRAKTFLLTALTEAEAIAQEHERCGTTTVQLVDHVAASERAALRKLRPGLRIVQVVHVRGADALDEACEAAEHSDALLLDSGNPAAARKELGGTGRVHDWEISARIVAAARVPVWLAGGLRADNVAQAVRSVRPFGVDLCSSVRTDDRLDAARLDALVAALRA